MRAITAVAGALAVLAFSAPGVRAQTGDSAEAKKLTILTFTEPVQLPGKVLPAGKYRFEIADANNAVHAVRVLSEDGDKVHGTFPTIPSVMAERDLRDQDTLVMFAERAAGQPQAAREWFYPGRSIGEEFLYSKDEAMGIAKANHSKVAVTDSGKTGHVNENGEFEEGK
jgi:hypothetical protein